MTKTLSSMVAVAALCLASQVSAATIDFSSNATGAAGATGLSGITYSAASSFGRTSNATVTPGSVGATAFGLGTGGDGQFSGGRIDGINKGTWEMLTVTFSAAVDLADFILGRMDTNDDFEYSINGGAFTSVAAPSSGSITPTTLTNPTSRQLYTFTAGWTNVLSFSIRATGDRRDRNRAGFTGDDDFTLAFANVTAVTRVPQSFIAPVPLPAGAPLLLAGLAGLAALRRRNKRA